ncbi:hypothetical protein B0H66DRAFT_613776 [Apodospora peruviana]|uniref:Uncharacterized protein n=1 Tax=Apodospora peruviana TaxID=516989 RepID=A0AAE0MH09_9PEZI|nr:hypothetical protein B0H66DRAFT_613776 [Apodospora peruviana]
MNRPDEEEDSVLQKDNVYPPNFLPTDADADAINHSQHNPTKMQKPFWKHMIVHGGKSDAGRKILDPLKEMDMQMMRVWCFNGQGRTKTKLPDGRIVFIGGQHEDWSDPDFVTYNDVVVRRPKSTPTEIDIYGYPFSTFPETKFHTATYYRDEASGGGKEYIYIIGGLDYGDGPHSKATLTFRLDLQDYSIQPIEATGDMPPPNLDDGTLERRCCNIGWGRYFIVVSDNCNKTAYRLSIPSMRWSRLYIFYWREDGTPDYTPWPTERGKKKVKR